MKRFLILCVILAIALFLCALGILWLDSVRWSSARAENNIQNFLPIAFKDYSEKPIWIKNPTNLPSANGWPGSQGIASEWSPDCPGECWIGTGNRTPPFYLIVEGIYAEFPFLEAMGKSPNGCYGVLVTEDWIWSFENGTAIYLPAGQAQHTLFRLMSVPDPALAPPLAWLAQLSEDVKARYPQCSEVDIGVYVKPSRLK